MRAVFKHFFRYYHMSRSQGNLSDFFSFSIVVVFWRWLLKFTEKGRNEKCSIFCGSASVFVRWVICHQAEGYICNIMSQILSFLTNVRALPVGSISSWHTKISAIYWYYFLVWILIPLDGAATDGDMLSIVLYLRRTFLARLFNHICIHFRDDIAVIPLLVPNFSSYKEWEYEL